jgi:hypothetical protein
MKKTLRNQVKRLVLSKETLRFLSDAGLQGAVGAAPLSLSCITECALDSDYCCVAW